MIEPIATYKEFMSICYESEIVREWEIKLMYEIYVATVMGWDDKIDETLTNLEVNGYYFTIGKLN